MDLINFISDDKKLARNLNFHGDIKLYRVQVEYLSPQGERLSKDIRAQTIMYKNSSFKKALTLFICKHSNEKEVMCMENFGAKLINVNGTKNR